MKRISAFLLITFILLLNFNVSASAAQIPPENLLFSEAFDGTVTGWTMDPSIKQVIRPNSGDDSNKSMQFAEKLPNKSLIKSLGNKTGMVTIEAEIMVSNETTQIKIPDVLVNGTTQAVLLSVIGSNVSAIYFNGTTDVRKTCPISIGEWFKVTIQCDTVTDKFSVWVNNNELVKDVRYYKGVDANTISSIKFYAMKDTDPSFFVDNVRAYIGEAVIEKPVEVDSAVADFMSKSIVMKKDNPIAYKTNFRKNMSVIPYEETGKVMLPVDEVAKGFYADSALDTVTNTQFISLNNNNIRLTEGLSYFIKNGEKINIDTPAVLKDGVMYASLSVIDAILDRDTYVDMATGIILVVQRGHLPSQVNIAAVISSIGALYSDVLLPAADIYVAADGLPDGDGTLNKPYSTIEAAQARVRTLISGGITGNINVNLRGGTYYLDKQISFDATDSHRGNYTVTYKNYNNEKVVIDGGKRLTGWKLYRDGIYETEIGADVNPNPQTLYEDGNRVTIARYPNSGYNRAIVASEATKRNFIFSEGDIPVVAKPKDLKLYIWPGGPGGHYNWSMARPSIVALDYAKRLVTLDKDLTYDIGTGSRYFAYNAPEFLDEPGEFYVDTVNKKIYYKPVNQNIEEPTIVAPPTFDLIKISGTATDMVRNLRFEGLNVKSTDLNKSNFYISDAENILISKCQIYNSGHIGIYMKGRVRNSRVENCHIYQMGYYGVFVEGTTNTSKMLCYGNSVTNCHIHNIGEMNGNAVGVRFTSTQYCYAAYNMVHDSPRNALHIFGDPDYKILNTTIEGTTVTTENVRDYKLSEYNTIEYNDASRCMQDSQDTNAIGTFGIDYFNVIRKNAVHDNYLPLITVKASDSFWFPFYFDENSNGSYLTSNISYNNQLKQGGPMRSAFMNNASKDNKVQNNVFADTTYSDGVITVNDMDGAVRSSSRIQIEKNVFSGFPNTIYDFTGWNSTTVGHIDNNLLNSSSGNYLLDGKLPEKTLAEWRKSATTPSDINSIIANPMFVSKDKNDYRLAYDSPAYTLGFEDINQSDIGLRSDYVFADPKDKLDKIYAYRQGDYLKKAWMSLSIGEKAKIDATTRTVNGYVADNNTLLMEYSSSDNSVASVDQQGNITTNGRGKCKITVTAQRDGISVNTEVEVIIDDSDIVKLNILDVGNSVEIGNTVEIKATGVTEFGRQKKMNEFVITSNRNDAEINNNSITFKGTGEFVITAVSKENPSVTGSTTINVKDASLKTVLLSLDKETYSVGETVGFSYKLIDSKGNTIEAIEPKVTLEGDKDGFVVIENGVPVAQKTGMGSLGIIVEYMGVQVVSSAKVAITKDNMPIPEGFTVKNYSPTGKELTAGYAYMDNGRVNLLTSGNDIWNVEDSASFLAKSIPGSQKLSVSATVYEVTNPGSYLAQGAVAIHAAAGVMIRDNDSADSNNIVVRYRLNGDVIMTYRTNEYRSTAMQKGAKPKQPVEVKIEKNGNKFTGYYKDVSGEWKAIATVECTMDDNIYAGVCLQSGVLGDYNSAQFSDIQIIQPELALAGPASVKAGEELSLALRLQSVAQSVYGADIILSYDANTLGFNTVLPASAKTVIENVYDDTPGIVRFLISSLEGTAFTGNEDLLYINFKAKNYSLPTNISFDSAVLAYETEFEENPALVNKTVQIIGPDKLILHNAIITAQAVYDSAVPGTQLGQYPLEAIIILQQAITVAQSVYDNLYTSEIEINLSAAELNNAVNEFLKKIIVYIPDHSSGNDDTNTYTQQPVIEKTDTVTDKIKSILDYLDTVSKLKQPEKEKLIEDVKEALSEAMQKVSLFDNRYILKTKADNELNAFIDAKYVGAKIKDILEAFGVLEKKARELGIQEAAKYIEKEIIVDLSSDEKEGVKLQLPVQAIKEATDNGVGIILKTGNAEIKLPTKVLETEVITGQPKDEKLEIKIAVLTGDKAAGYTNAGTTDKSRNERFSGVSSLYDFEANWVLKDTLKTIEHFNEKINVQLSFDTSKIKDANRVGVYFYNPETKEWDYAGGKPGAQEGKIVFSTEHFSVYTVMEYNKTFDDISRHWAKNDIESMASRRIIKGVSEDSFNPDNTISRAEFAALMIRTLELDTIKYSGVFNDVDMESWYADVVQTAAAHGLVTGFEGNFRPEDQISREEMAILLMRTYIKAGGKMKNSEAVNKLADVKEISTWAQEAVMQANSLGLIKGDSEGNFAPSESTTRAQAAVVIGRILSMLDNQQ